MCPRLHDLVARSLSLWSVPQHASLRLLNVAENIVYLIEGAAGFRSVLRVHRQGYHTKRAIECELAWMQALCDDRCAAVPGIMAGRDGQAVQRVGGDDPSGERFMVMFEFVAGSQPDGSQHLVRMFAELGKIAANLHEHAIAWSRPDPFQRLVWDIAGFYGSRAIWGDWRDGPNMDRCGRAILERVEKTVRRRLRAFGQGKQRFGLIHADMRLTNLLVGEQATRLIDFDDCGPGWFLYDFAASVSFLEDHAEMPAMREAWGRGYRKVRALPDEEEREIDSFIMMRRMALLAWLGSRPEVPEARRYALGFARVTAELGERYLSRMA